MKTLHFYITNSLHNINVFSLCLYKIGHITKVLFRFLRVKVLIEGLMGFFSRVFLSKSHLIKYVRTGESKRVLSAIE